eukprot:751727-Hanusia_phi.AAC.10
MEMSCYILAVVVRAFGRQPPDQQVAKHDQRSERSPSNTEGLSPNVDRACANGQVRGLKSDRYAALDALGRNGMRGADEDQGENSQDARKGLSET